jgi:hypothetical protein
MSDLVALSYDTLPPQSNLRRAIDPRGRVQISISAGEPGVLARRVAMYDTAWLSAVWSTLITTFLALLLLPVFLVNRPQTQALSTLLMMMAGVFFSAMFLLVWWLEYRKRMDSIERAALQATVISIAPNQVLTETVGPFGTRSESIAPPFELFVRRVPASRAECLHVVSRTGQTVHLFPGLSHIELNWLAAEIRTAMNTPAVRDGCDCPT